MFPKSDVIQKVIKNKFLRVVMYTATGEERERLEKAFPECYSADRNELRVSETALQERCRKRYVEQGVGSPGSRWGGDELEKFGIPIAFTWHRNAGNWGADGPIPEEVWKQVLGQPWQSCLAIEYRDEKFLLVNHPNSMRWVLGERICEPEIGHMLLLDFVHARFINLNS